MSDTECMTQKVLFEVGSQRVTADFDGGQVVTDAGLLAIRQLDLELGVLAGAARCFPDPRAQDLITHSVEQLLTQRVYQALGGYHDGNDAQWLRSDPLYQTLAGVSPDADAPLASGSTCNRFLNAYTRREGERPPEDREVIYEQRQAQIDRIIGLNKYLVDLYIRTRRVRPERIIIDVDPTDDPAHGRQQLTLWHGYYDQNQYYPVLAFDGDSGLPLAAWLRAGNSGAACGVVDILREIVDHLRGVWPDIRILLRGDCGVGGPQVYEYCEAAGLSYAVGYAANEVLKRRTRDEMVHVDIVTWAYGRPHRQFQTFDDYQAGSWDRPRRVIAKLETTATLEGNRRFLVTNMTESPQFIYEEFYCRRGDVPERSIGELKQGLGIDRLSSHRFLNNAQKLLIHVLAYSLWVLFREANAAVPEIARAELPTAQARLFKVGALVECSVRRIWVRFSTTWPFRSVFQRACDAVEQFASEVRAALARETLTGRGTTDPPPASCTPLK